MYRKRGNLLADVGAEVVTQGGMEEVCCGVVLRKEGTSVGVDMEKDVLRERDLLLGGAVMEYEATERLRGIVYVEEGMIILGDGSVIGFLSA